MYFPVIVAVFLKELKKIVKYVLSCLWVAPLDEETHQMTTEEKTTGEKASGVQIGTLVVSILTLLVALVLATKQPASERSKQSWANPVSVAMSASRA